ncbi:MAG: YbjN domain-containing protein [Thermosynechococcaceae cyanobacterium]
MQTYDLDVATVDLNSADNHYTDVIETVISSLDQSHSSLVNRTQSGHLWKFQYGSVDVLIQLTGSTEEDTFTAWSPVLTLPVQNEAGLMRKLMELNWMGTFEARFGIFKDSVVVVTSRSVADLSPGEISHLITIVATIADDYDDELQAAFPSA